MIGRTVKEWDYLPIEPVSSGPLAFTRSLADQMLKIARSSKIGGDEGEQILIDGRSRLRAQQVVGVLVAKGATLEILPKIDGANEDQAIRRSLIHMLAVVLDLDISAGAAANFGWQKENLLEILIRLFCDKLLAILHQGMPRRYVGHEDDLSALRGRLDVKRQFTVLAASPQRLACRFDELSTDIPLNRIMKAAITRLMSMSNNLENQRKLRELAFAYEGVAILPVRSLLATDNSWEILMTSNKYAMASLALSLAICAGAARAGDNGLITKPSKYSVRETVTRFEAAVKQKEAAGFMVFTEIDHAAAAKKFGLDMRPRTVIVFGNPKLGTPAMIKTPQLAIDVPPKALVWEDNEGKVWLSYNSSDYLSNTIYPRHGATAPSNDRAIRKVSRRDK